MAIESQVKDLKAQAQAVRAAAQHLGGKLFSRPHLMRTAGEDSDFQELLAARNDLRGAVLALDDAIDEVKTWRG